MRTIVGAIRRFAYLFLVEIFLNKTPFCTFVHLGALFKLVQVFLNKTQKCILQDNKCAFCTFVRSENGYSDLNQSGNGSCLSTKTQ